MITNMMPLDTRLKQLNYAEDILETERMQLAASIETTLEKNQYVGFIPPLNKHILYLEERQGYYFEGKIVIPIDPLEKPYRLEPAALLAARVERRIQQLSHCKTQNKKLSESQLKKIAQSIENTLLRKDLHTHQHSSKKEGHPFGISISAVKNKLYVNLKSKQQTLVKSGSYKKVRLAIEVPIPYEKKAEFVAHKSFAHSNSGLIELTHQQRFDKTPLLIRAIVIHPKHNKNVLQTSVYETLIENDLDELHPDQLNENEKRSLLLQLINQLIDMHNADHLHGDVKATNIIVDFKRNGRFIDYGFTCNPRETKPRGLLANGYYGSLYNTPPEILGKGRRYQLKYNDLFKVETFALGVAFWSWMKERPDFTNIPEELMYGKIKPNRNIRNRFHNVVLSYVEEQTKMTEKPFEKIILKLMHPSPKERMTLQEARDLLNNLSNPATTVL